MSAVLSTRVAKLIPMLSSDQDGEVLAAVRAIGRTLKSEGQDFHWIASRLVGAHPVLAKTIWPKPPWNPTTEPHPEYRPRKAKTTKPRWDDFRRSVQTDWLNRLIIEPWLSDIERSLVANLRRRMHAGMLFHLEPNLKRMLTKLMEKATCMGVAP